MPRVKIDYVVSFSSEDPENQANNLLSWDVSKKKWLCTKGEPSCSVVLQLVKAVKISSVQIGVQHAALVEVLVGRSETPNDPYQVLVPSSVFLNPKESRSDTAIDRVRSFDGNTLAPASLARWDRVRIVCSQPYNKHCKFGVSFIHIFEPEGDPAVTAPTAAPPSRTTSAHLLLDTMSSDEEVFRPGEMFAKYRQSTSADTGSQIRQATSQALKNDPTAATKLMKTPLSKNKPATTRCPESRDGPRDKDNLLYTDDDERPHAKIDLVVQRHKDEKTKDKPIPKTSEKTNDKVDKAPRSKESTKKDSESNDHRKERDETVRQNKNRETNKNYNRRDKDDNRKQNDERDGNNSKKDNDQERRSYKNEASGSKTKDNDNGSKTKDKDSNRKRAHSNQNRASNASTSSESSLTAGPRSERPLAGVILVLSGYENPRRARVRDLALSLGARVHRDWGPECTHLICAFPNTPKLRAVRADRRGRVPVTRAEWIEECGRVARHLPWQWYATETKDLRDPPPTQDYTTHTDTEQQLSECDTDDEIEAVLRQKRARVSSPAPPTHTPRGGRPSDDDGEVEFVRDERMQGSNITLDDSESSGLDTDVEEPPPRETRTSEEAPESALPPLFAGLTFVLDAELVRPLDAQLLHRYCVAYGGLVLKPSELDEESGEHYELCGSLAAAAARHNSRAGAVRVRGDWLWACHERHALAPLTPYIL